MTTVKPPSGIFDRNKRHQRRLFAAKNDVYWYHGRLMHEAERSASTLERLLCVIKLVLTMYTDVLRSSEEFEDVPVHCLGVHLLTHRDIESHATGIEERLLVQEIASLDVNEKPRSRTYPGQAIARLHLPIQPQAYTARESLLAAHALLKVELKGEGVLELLRHSEIYTFTYPKLVFHNPLSPDCPLSLKGKIAIKCPATGLSCAMSLSSDGAAKGVVQRLAGPGFETVCTFNGHWNDRIDVTDTSNEMQGVLFAEGDVSPRIAQTIDLSHIHGRRLHRLWTTLHDALIYVDPLHTRSKVGQNLCRSVSSWMKGLMPDSVVTAAIPTAREDSDEDDTDQRSIPPSIKAVHRQGGSMHYCMDYLLTALNHEERHVAQTAIPETAATSLLDYWRRQKAAKSTA